MISRATFNDHTHPLFCNKHILKLEDLYKLEIAKNILKYKQDALPKPLMVLFKTQNEIHNKNTRQRNDLHIRKHRTTLGSHDITCKGPQIWNSLPVQFKEWKFGIATFSVTLSNYILQNYSLVTE